MYALYRYIFPVYFPNVLILQFCIDKYSLPTFLWTWKCYSQLCHIVPNDCLSFLAYFSPLEILIDFIFISVLSSHQN